MEERGFSPKRSQSHEQGSEIVESKWCPRCQQYAHETCSIAMQHSLMGWLPMQSMLDDS